VWSDDVEMEMWFEREFSDAQKDPTGNYYYGLVAAS
jgi:hypothetical protein